MALAPLAILEVHSHAPRLIEAALQGQNVSVAWRLAGESVASPASANLQILSPWSELAAGARWTIGKQSSQPGLLQVSLLNAEQRAKVRLEMGSHGYKGVFP